MGTMKVESAESILAIITLNREIVGGGAPIFYARDEDERERLALYLSRITKGLVHDLENGTYIIVKH